MKLRRFNNDGIGAFRDYRARLAIEPLLPSPVQLLQDAAYTEVVSDTELPARNFATRLEAGRFFEGLLDAANVPSPERDQGLWAWLTLFYFDQVCPPDESGRRDPKTDEARLIPSLDNYQRFYRHLLLGPYLIVRAHRDQPDRAIGMLCNPLWKPGEIAEQLASRKELVTNPAVVEAATTLYYDATSGSFKRGAGAKVRGAPRRLADLLNQLDLTYYLYGMKTSELLALLPKEFDRFRKSASS
jgi:hypothetical protein